MQKNLIIFIGLIACLCMASKAPTYEQLPDAKRTNSQAGQERGLPGVLMLLLGDPITGDIPDPGLSNILLVVAPEHLEIEGGESRQLTYAVEPADAEVIFTSSEASIAAVDSGGKVSAVGGGTSKIYVTATKDGYNPALKEVIVNVTIYYTLTIEKSGQGTVLPAPGLHNYPAGTIVELKAAPASGWKFDYWEGNVTSDNKQETITMDGNRKVRASFTIYELVRSWNTGVYGTGITVFSSDTYAEGIYLTGADKIHRFDTEGNFLKQWGSSGYGPGEFDGTGGITMIKADPKMCARCLHAPVYHVCVSDTRNQRVQRLEIWHGVDHPCPGSTEKLSPLFGSKGTGEGEFETPWGLAWFSDPKPADLLYPGDPHWGYYFVADMENKRVQKFTKNGTFVLKWGEAGYGDGEFMQPYGIAVGFNYVYVTDAFVNRIQKFDVEGNHLATWGSFGSADGELNGPRSITTGSIGANHYVYVADSDNHRIQIFDPNGSFVASLGTGGSDEGQFNKPNAVAVNEDGNLYVNDSGNQRIQVFRPVQD